MKLSQLLEVFHGTTILRIASADTNYCVFCGITEDARTKVPGNYLYGEVKLVYGEYFKDYYHAGISILVNPRENRH